MILPRHRILGLSKGFQVGTRQLGRRNLWHSVKEYLKRTFHPTEILAGFSLPFSFH